MVIMALHSMVVIAGKRRKALLIVVLAAADDNGNYSPNEKYISERMERRISYCILSTFYILLMKNQ